MGFIFFDNVFIHCWANPYNTLNTSIAINLKLFTLIAVVPALFKNTSYNVKSLNTNRSALTWTSWILYIVDLLVNNHTIGP